MFHVRFPFKYDAMTSRERRQRAAIGQLSFRSNTIGRVWQFFSEEGRGDPNVLEGSPPALLVSSLSVGQDGGPRSPWRWRYYAGRMPDPLDVASGPRRRSLAQIGSGGSSFLDKDQFLSTTTWPTRRAGSSQMEQRLPSSGLHWMTCVPTRHPGLNITRILLRFRYLYKNIFISPASS